MQRFHESYIDISCQTPAQRGVVKVSWGTVQLWVEKEKTTSFWFLHTGASIS